MRFGAREKMSLFFVFLFFLQYPGYTSKNLSMKGVHAGTSLYTSNVRFYTCTYDVCDACEFTDSRLLLLLSLFFWFEFDFDTTTTTLQSTREVSVWLLQIIHS